MDSRKPKRWLRFSLRSLIFLLLLTAVGFAAFHSRLRNARRRAAAVQRLKDFAGFVRYDNFAPSSSRAVAESTALSEWLTEQFGVDFFQDVESVCISGGERYSDADFALTCRLRNVQSLRLGRTLVTDDGLAPISNLRELRVFSIGSSHITDQGMQHIVGLPRLERLTLYDVDLTDVGLARLAALPKLELLQIKRTRVTAHGIESLRTALPQCEISY